MFLYGRKAYAIRNDILSNIIVIFCLDAPNIPIHSVEESEIDHIDEYPNPCILIGQDIMSRSLGKHVANTLFRPVQTGLISFHRVCFFVSVLQWMTL